jgi:hypothetical protein
MFGNDGLDEALPLRAARGQIVHHRAQDAQMCGQERLVDRRHLILTITIHPGGGQARVPGKWRQRLRLQEVIEQQLVQELSPVRPIAHAI